MSLEEIRKTKSEIRNKSKIRNSKHETEQFLFRILDFVFRICFGFRVSDFLWRACHPTLSILGSAAGSARGRTRAGTRDDGWGPRAAVSIRCQNTTAWSGS